MKKHLFLTNAFLAFCSLAGVRADLIAFYSFDDPGNPLTDDSGMGNDLTSAGADPTFEVAGLAVGSGDQLFFRFHTAGDPGGDIVRAAITIEGSPGSPPAAPQPAGGTITAGSSITFTAPGDGGGPFQWRKDGKAIAGRGGPGRMALLPGGQQRPRHLGEEGPHPRFRQTW